MDVTKQSKILKKRLSGTQNPLLHEIYTKILKHKNKIILLEKYEAEKYLNDLKCMQMHRRESYTVLKFKNELMEIILSYNKFEYVRQNSLELLSQKSALKHTEEARNNLYNPMSSMSSIPSNMLTDNNFMSNNSLDLNNTKINLQEELASTTNSCSEDMFGSKNDIAYRTLNNNTVAEYLTTNQNLNTSVEETLNNGLEVSINSMSTPRDQIQNNEIFKRPYPKSFIEDLPIIFVDNTFEMRQNSEYNSQGDDSAASLPKSISDDDTLCMNVPKMQSQQITMANNNKNNIIMPETPINFSDAAVITEKMSIQSELLLQGHFKEYNADKGLNDTNFNPTLTLQTETEDMVISPDNKPNNKEGIITETHLKTLPYTGEKMETDSAAVERHLFEDTPDLNMNRTLNELTYAFDSCLSECNQKFSQMMIKLEELAVECEGIRGDSGSQFSQENEVNALAVVNAFRGEYGEEIDETKVLLDEIFGEYKEVKDIKVETDSDDFNSDDEVKVNDETVLDWRLIKIY